MPKPIIWVVDTSVLLNILEHPQRSQDRAEVLEQFRDRIESGHRFVIPITTIIETGNWAYKMPAGQRKDWVDRFIRTICGSLAGSAPFIVLEFPTQEDVANYLDDLPRYIETMGLGDLVILRQYEQLCASGKFGGYQINIWSLDGGALQGRECNH